jgi:N-acetylmuramoyl-L-alanine amidase
MVKKLSAVGILVLLLILSLPVATDAAALRYGDSGESVRQMQSKLKAWGYYSGGVDGVFGAQTREAVKRFQRRNGLTADGIVGVQTAAAMGLKLPDHNSELYLLARCVHAEARGEPYTGKVAVAAVVLNRVKSPSFPNTVSGVIYQPRAFTAVADGQINLTPDNESIRAARDALNGWDPTGGCLYYYNPAKTTSSWIYSRPVMLVIGNHRFAA